MPQLDFSTFPSQLFWLAATFLALYFFMARVGLPKVGAVLAQRQAKIDGDLERASQMQAEAAAILAAYERALADARAQAQVTLREAMERLNAESAERQRQAIEQLGQQALIAERRIDEAKSQALGNLRMVAIEVARSAAARLCRIEIDESQAADAVDRVMKERA